MSRIRPSQMKKQALEQLLNGTQTAGSGGLLSELVRLSVEKTVQELLEAEQDEYLGRDRYERGGQRGVPRKPKTEDRRHCPVLVQQAAARGVTGNPALKILQEIIPDVRGREVGCGRVFPSVTR
ncbi:MAG: hypothetical protein KJ626_10200 [Verrucomicrobia bacterium]|nr:hypothetical protein [Verrucomicrobiota bacterium]